VNSFRSILRNRLGAAVAVSTLACGIGVAVALIILVDALTWRGPSAVADPERLVAFSATSNYVEYRSLADVRGATLAAVVRTELPLGAGGSTNYMAVECISPNYFGVVGVRAAQGRLLLPSDADRDAIVLSDALWRRLGQPALGSDVVVGLRRYAIVGVTPAGFAGLEFAPASAWITLEGSPDPCSFTGRSLLASAASFWLGIVGRLANDATVPQLDAEIARRIAQAGELRGGGRSAIARTACE